MEKEIVENHQRFLARKALYKNFGYDIDRERGWIIKKSQPISGNILEVGTGKGYFSLLLAQAGYRFTSIDISEEEQEFARLNLKYFALEKSVNFRIENAEHLSFKNNSYDLIFSVNTFHHLKDPLMVMDEFIRVVTPRGKIVLADFTTEGLEVIAKMHQSESRVHKVNYFRLTDLDKNLRAKGFIVNKYRSKFQQILIADHQL
jgi:ubiquinone/menaquinone biosynthesis C-methylase UbiE